MRHSYLHLALAAALALTPIAACADAFTFQGYVEENGRATNGALNLSFTLYDVATGGIAVAPVIQRNAYPIANGVFTVDLDFAGIRFDGRQFWIEVEADGAVLGPRLLVQPAPLASSTNALRGFRVGGATPAAGDALVWDGSQWSPRAGGGFSAGTGLVLTGSVFSIPPEYRLPTSCASGEVAKWTGSAWDCAADQQGGGSGPGAGLGLVESGGNLAIADSFRLPQSCSGNAVAKWNGVSWACDADQDTTYSAGFGLALSPTREFSLLQSQRFPAACQADQTVKWNAAQSEWQCAVDADGTVTAGDGLLKNGTTMHIAPDYRLPQGCSADQMARWNGVAWTCMTLPAQTVWNAAGGLTIDGNTIFLPASYRLPQNCSLDQTAVWNGGEWACANSVASQLPTAGTGVELTTGVISLLPSYRLPQTCAVGQVTNWSGTAWTCTSPQVSPVLGVGTGLELATGTVSVHPDYRLPQVCGFDDVLKWDGSSWTCGGDNVGSNYTIGSGLKLVGSQLSADFAGSGSAATVSRSDHGHFGAQWGGASPASGLRVTNSASGVAIEAEHVGSSGTALSARARGSSGVAISALADASNSVAVKGTALSADAIGVVGVNGAGTGVAAQGRVGMDAFGTLVGALLKADGASSVAAKVTNSTVTGAARGLQSQVHSADGQAVVAEALATSGRTRGVEGIVRSPDGIGVYAENQATSPGGGNALAALSHTSSPTAVLANVSGGAAAAMYGAVEVRGDVSVSGVLSKAGGSFKIDHPLDPENKYLYHSFVESDEMMNIYAGNVVTDSNGRAEVQLPAWFEVLNRDFRYQLTTIGSFAQSMVEEELVANRFVIRTNVPHIKVSWQVTGVREDRWAEQHRIPVEQDKPEAERGKYLHPELFGQPKTLQVGYRPGLIQAPSDPPAKID